MSAVDEDSDDAQQPAAQQRKINEKDSVPVITDAHKMLADRVRQRKRPIRQSKLPYKRLPRDCRV